MKAVDDVRDRLIRDDAHYRALNDRHREYDSRLDELRAQRFLTAEEQIEETRLKKLKLAIKDEMESIVRDAGD